MHDILCTDKDKFWTLLNFLRSQKSSIGTFLTFWAIFLWMKECIFLYCSQNTRGATTSQFFEIVGFLEVLMFRRTIIGDNGFKFYRKIIEPPPYSTCAATPLIMNPRSLHLSIDWNVVLIHTLLNTRWLAKFDSP